MSQDFPSDSGLRDRIADARRQAEAARSLNDRSRRVAAIRAAAPDLDSRLAGARVADDIPEELLEHYDISGEVHRGGQGVVYAAVQKSTQRRVAIKIMRAGPYASREDLVRFEREVQILAQINHPAIVGILDSGVSRGLFYFVMEYVDGQSLGAWMAEHPSSTPQTGESSRSRWRSLFSGSAPESRGRLQDSLRLFLQVCQAVHAAHLHGVIHRDLKPGNIQIDRRGQPHILDFGMAKMASAESPDSSAPVTHTGRFFGSIPWASPEQASGRFAAVDVRSDVYALGVILYQLVAGRFPYPVEGGFADVLHNVLHAEPARLRSANPDAGDELETIVFKCLQKDPQRRYQSAGDLAEDIRRHLAGEPIAANRDVLPYLIRKQLRRHAAPIAVSISFLILVCVGAVVSLVLWRQSVAAEKQAAEQRDRAVAAEHDAVAQRAEAEAVVKLLESALVSADPLNVRGPDYTVVQLLEDVSTGIGDSLRGQPRARARLELLIGSAYRKLTRLDKAETYLRAALELNRTAYGPAADATLNNLRELGFLYKEQAKWTEARASFQEALDEAVAAYGEDSAPAVQALKGLGETLLRAGQYDEAGPIVRRAAALARDSGEPSQLASCLHNLGTLLDELNDPAAEATYRESIAIYRKVLDPMHPDIAVGLIDLAQVLMKEDKLDDAETHFKEAIDILAKCYGPDHVKVAVAQEILAMLHNKQGRMDEAEAVVRRALEARRRALNPDHPSIAGGLNNLGTILNARGDYQGARDAFLQSIEVMRRSQMADSPNMATTLNNLARAEFGMGNHAAAVQHLRESLELNRKNLPAGHPAIVDDLRGLSLVFEAMGDFGSALDAQREILAAMQSGDRAGDGAERSARARLADLLARMGNDLLADADPDASEAAAIAALRESLAIRRDVLPADDWRIGSVCSLLGAALLAADRPDEAEPLLEEGWTLLRGATGAPAPLVRDAAERHARRLELRGEEAAARAVRDALHTATRPPAQSSQPDGGD